jgi:hypothetical protein
MKEIEKPFNPVPIPADLKLAQEAAANGQPAKALGVVAPINAKTMAGIKAKRPKRTRSTVLRLNKDCQTNWVKLKGKINARLGQLDRAKLKKLLKACGVGAAVVLAVMIAPKVAPIAVLLLALLGLGVLIRLWNRLRRLPAPI